jgi:hypothetical protein
MVSEDTRTLYAETRFQATGKGWQTRVNVALRQFIAEHPLGR